MPGGPNEQQKQQQQQPQPQAGQQSNPQSQPNLNPQPGPQQPQPDPQDALLPEEDDLPDEGPLNIDQIISEAEKEKKQAPPRSRNEKRTEAKFKADPRSFDEIATGVEFALDKTEWSPLLLYLGMLLVLGGMTAMTLHRIRQHDKSPA